MSNPTLCAAAPLREISLKPNQFRLPSGAVITERPILFQTEMVQANLEDSKTQTRRQIKPELPEEKHSPWNHRERNVWQWQTGKFHVNYIGDERFCPYGKPGDLLWVRETWNYDKIDRVSKSEFHIPTGINCAFVYKAENIEASHLEYGKMSWKPSIHMPKVASRLWMMTEEVRVERLQDISEKDAIAEGIEIIHWAETTIPVFRNYLLKEKLGTINPIKSFQSLICKINGKGIWEQNPWVWVVKFRMLSKTGRPSMEVISKAYEEVVNRKSEIVTGKEADHV